MAVGSGKDSELDISSECPNALATDLKTGTYGRDKASEGYNMFFNSSLKTTI